MSVDFDWMPKLNWYDKTTTTNTLMEEPHLSFCYIYTQFIGFFIRPSNILYCWPYLTHNERKKKILQQFGIDFVCIIFVAFADDCTNKLNEVDMLIISEAKRNSYDVAFSVELFYSAMVILVLFSSVDALHFQESLRGWEKRAA